MPWRVCVTLLALLMLLSVSHAALPQAPPSAAPASVQRPEILTATLKFKPDLQPAAQLVSSPGPIVPFTTAYLISRKSRQPGPRLTFPLQSATTNGIRRMAAGQVSSRPNRCAASMREAMGWGLGDAHQWMRLGKIGFKQRAKGQVAAGDIIVWPFTYGSRRSQHIGFAVGTERGLRLLSNLSGNICLKSVVPGYAAFYKSLAPLALPGPVAPDPLLNNVAQHAVQHLTAALQPTSPAAPTL